MACTVIYGLFPRVLALAPIVVHFPRFFRRSWRSNGRACFCKRLYRGYCDISTCGRCEHGETLTRLFCRAAYRANARSLAVVREVSMLSRFGGRFHGLPLDPRGSCRASSGGGGGCYAGGRCSAFAVYRVRLASLDCAPSFSLAIPYHTFAGMSTTFS